MPASAVNVIVPSINHERNVPLFQPLTGAGAVAVAKRTVQDSGSQAISSTRMSACLSVVVAVTGGADIFEGLRDIQGNERLILDAQKD